MKMTWAIRSLPVGTLILSALALLTLPIIVRRFVYGLGAISNLSDGCPWGLWISFDLYCGVALAAGGFTLAGAVYIFRRELYYPVARPAILTAFLGYLLVILALLIDLGQPWYIWHVIINWNIHSPLFEVGVCVATYTTVLALEFSPAVFERLNWRVPLRAVRAIQIPLVIAGITLSTLHQSSLGTMLLMMPSTLDPLWYSPILPILFLCSALAVGPAVVICESSLSSRAFGHDLKTKVLGGLGKTIPYLLGFYLLLKIVDLAVAGELGLIFTHYPMNMLWWAEVIIGIILPIILFSSVRLRHSRRKLFWSAMLVILGLVLNRLTVSWFALGMPPGTTYFPHWMEIAISVGLVADAILVFVIANRVLPMVRERRQGKVITEASVTTE
jgi:Ni/Fe-hydrogenase subunit HybB-like protein